MAIDIGDRNGVRYGDIWATFLESFAVNCVGLELLWVDKLYGFNFFPCISSGGGLFSTFRDNSSWVLDDESFCHIEGCKWFQGSGQERSQGFVLIKYKFCSVCVAGVVVGGKKKYSGIAVNPRRAADFTDTNVALFYLF